MQVVDEPEPPETPEPGGTVVVVAGGEALDPRLRSVVPDEAIVVAADSGLDHAFALGLAVTTVVGDLDSVSEAALAAAREGGTEVLRYPEAKDATDLALALTAAAARRPRAIVVLGGHGGRLDHQQANLLLLAAPGWVLPASVAVTAWMGAALVTVIRARVGLRGAVGSTVSLLPANGPAGGITTRGLTFPLADEDLPAGITRGISNRFEEPLAEVSIRHGALLAIQPDAIEELP
ncbi:MAG: thiamine diphosphokinase [Acidimicrobiales bacterium]